MADPSKPPEFSHDIVPPKDGQAGPPPRDRAADDPLLAHIAYGLYAIGYFVFFTLIVGLVMAYVKRGDARGTWIESHYTWQIRTFWYYILLYAVGIFLIITVIGMLVAWIIFAIATAWGVYRLVKGWILLSQRRAIDNPTGIF
jgi:uncharacterized membrane protein